VKIRAGHFSRVNPNYTSSLRPIHHLIHIGQHSNLDLKEAKWELYKLSISFQPFVSFSNDFPKFQKESNHRVFFQNAEGNINMGVFFNDPDVGIDEIYWYNMLATEMKKSLVKNEGLISIDEELNVRSCYVELHRKG